MNTQRFTEEHFAHNAPNGEMHHQTQQSQGMSGESSATDWIQEKVASCPTTSCLVAFAIGTGIGALVVHALKNGHAADESTSMVHRVGKRVMDSLMDVLPAGVASNLQSKFGNGSCS